MKKKGIHLIIIIFSTLLLSTSCKHTELPEGVIDTATLADFLTEMHLIDGYNNTVVRENRDSLTFQVEAAYDSLFRKYNITTEQYDSTMAYYARNPEDLDAVYRRVIIRLKREIQNCKDDKDRSQE